MLVMFRKYLISFKESLFFHFFTTKKGYLMKNIVRLVSWTAIFSRFICIDVLQQALFKVLFYRKQRVGKKKRWSTIFTGFSPLYVIIWYRSSLMTLISWALCENQTEQASKIRIFSQVKPEHVHCILLPSI